MDMKLVIETCLTSYLVALVEKDKVTKHIFAAKCLKKSDRLANDVEKLIGSKLASLTAIYVTNGPGSFMGLRAGLIYAYTLATSLNIPLWTASSLNFLAQGSPGNYYLDAKSGQSFTQKFPQGEVKLVPFKPNSLFQIQKFLQDPLKSLQVFKRDAKPLAHYYKKPKVG